MVDEILGTDIKVGENGDIVLSTKQDLATVSGIENLKQAMLVKLLVRKGEYFIEDFGSELYKLKGEPVNEATKSRAQGYVYEALLSEPRIEDIEEVEIEFVDIGVMNISVTVIPIDSQEPLNLIFPNFAIN